MSLLIGPLLPTLRGVRVIGELPPQVLRVHSDTRSVQPGDLFVALRGERFDAHDFLAQAKAAGAVAAIAERGLAAAGLCGVEVPDSRRALAELAARWRAQMRLPLVAVTGSNGKTTVTQMLGAIFRAAAGEHSLATRGNFNNDIGLPLTLLRLLPSHRLAVVELGMNHPGEIAQLAAIARPTVALVNNAQREHQEFMDSVEAVARENGEVIAALDGDGVAVFPADDAHAGVWEALAAGRRSLRFSDQPGVTAEVTGSGLWQDGRWQVTAHTPQGELTFTLALPGRHNLRNALAATAAALAAGVAPQAIVAGLSGFEPVAGRSHAVPLTVDGRVLTLIDDSYNANPDSVLAAIEVLAAQAAPRLLVLGDMGEVGNQALAFHVEVLQRAQGAGIEHVLCTGRWFGEAVAQRSSHARHLAEIDDLCQAAQALVQGVASVLIKGSRFMRMERVVQALTAAGAHAQGGDHAA